jgi:hypothetical protein
MKAQMDEMMKEPLGGWVAHGWPMVAHGGPKVGGAAMKICLMVWNMNGL